MEKLPNNLIVYILIIILNSFDGIFTYIMINAGKARELNPIMLCLINYNPIVFLLIKLSVVPLLILMLWKYKYKLHWSFITTVLVIYSALVIYELTFLF